MPSSSSIARGAKGPTPASETAGPVHLDDITLLSAPAIAELLDVSRSFWLQQVADGKAPPPVIRLPRMTRWRKTSVLAWIDAQASPKELPAAEAGEIPDTGPLRGSHNRVGG